MAEYKDITGRRSGRLTAKQFHHKDATGQYWLCECVCGRTRIVSNMRLLTGNVRTCGREGELCDAVASAHALYLKQQEKAYG